MNWIKGGVLAVIDLVIVVGVVAAFNWLFNAKSSWADIAFLLAFVTLWKFHEGNAARAAIARAGGEGA